MFQKIIPGTLSECKTVWIKIRPDMLMGLGLGPNCLQRFSAMKKFTSRRQEKHNSYPACKELTHISLAFFLWDIGRQTRRRRMWHPIRVSTACLQNAMKMKNTTKQPLKWKWTGPINKSGKFHLASIVKQVPEATWIPVINIFFCISMTLGSN